MMNQMWVADCILAACTRSVPVGCALPLASHCTHGAALAQLFFCETHANVCLISMACHCPSLDLVVRRSN